MDELQNRSDYYSHVKFLAECIVEQIDESEQPIQEIVFETVDNDQYIIYTAHNLDILRHSDSNPQDWKHLAGETDDWKRVIQSMAFDVLRTDLYSELREMGVEV